MKKYIGLIIGLLPLIASSQLVMSGNFDVMMSGGTLANPTSLVLTNGTSAGITYSGTGYISSENEFNQVDWAIGTRTGTYMVPFGDASLYMPLTADITGAGTGSGVVKFATYHTATWDNLTYEPSDVTNMTDFARTNYSNNVVDRFWILDANGYTTKPGVSLTFTYARTGGSSDIATPNNITESALIAQRFNSGTHVWTDFFGSTGTDVTTTNTGIVSSGAVSAINFYRSWSLFNDSTLLTSVPEISITSSIVAYPNPGNGNFTISGLTRDQAVELYDVIGQKLSSWIVDNSHHAI